MDHWGWQVIAWPKYFLTNFEDNLMRCWPEDVEYSIYSSFENLKMKKTMDMIMEWGNSLNYVLHLKFKKLMGDAKFLLQKSRQDIGPLQSMPGMNARRKFILLGSSGECLPVSRHPASRYSSCHSSDDGDYFSAQTSISDNCEFFN